MKTNVFFVHIAKTGGVTVESILKSMWPDEETCPWYEERDYLVSDTPPSRYSLFFGHLPLYVQSVLPHPCYTFTILRDPIARTISAYEHVMRDENHILHDIAKTETSTIIDFLNHPKLGVTVSNPQTRFLGNKANFESIYYRVKSRSLTVHAALSQLNKYRTAPCTEDTLSVASANLTKMNRFGITERLEECLYYILGDLDLATSNTVPLLNSNPNTGNALSRYSSREITAVESRNKYDLELYNYAKAKLCEWNQIRDF